MKRNYALQKMNLDKNTKREEERYDYHQRVDSKLREALTATNITAPEDGMVIYARTRWNRKIRIGDEVGPWRPVIATLPDLSVLISETYIEEIDVAKISLYDSVTVTVDALPGKVFTGKISSIANIGQELRGHNAKVFFVTIELDKNNSNLLPGMTSSNHITIEKTADQITIPRKCLFSEKGTQFVYLKEEGKIQKKKVKTGQENDEAVVITEGLGEKDRILLMPPENADEIKFMLP
jgi:multidrug resistance efflux pump